jgi:plasmid maintenance system antidote protein VapI
MAIRLEKAVGGDAGLWLRMQASYDLAQARLKKPASSIRKLVSKVA